MRRRHLCCLLAAALSIAGCGSGEGSDTGGTAAGGPAPPASAFPATEGKTLAQVLESADEADIVVSPAASAFRRGPNRFPFGVFENDHSQIADAEVALYIAPGPGDGKTKEGPALGPFPARIESIETQSAFRAQTTSDDPDAATVVYVADVDFPTDGEWRVVAAVRDGDRIGATLVSSVVVGEFEEIPRVGERAPSIHTPTAADVGGDLAQITTRIPPDTQNQVDYADALGREPIVLLFATPQFCVSRVCGPVVDVNEELKQLREDDAAFIHMEIFEDNEPPQPRPQVRAFNLQTEPWLFVIDADGKIVEVIEGAFGPEAVGAALDEAVRAG